MNWENISLKLYQHNNKPFLSASELYCTIFPYNNQKYARWVRMNITHQPQELPKKGVDYVSFSDAKIKSPERIRGGKQRIDYLVSITFALQLCYQAKTLPAKEVKDFLYKLTEK